MEVLERRHLLLSHRVGATAVKTETIRYFILSFSSVLQLVVQSLGFFFVIYDNVDNSGSVHWYRDLPRLITILSVFYFVIGKSVFTPLRDLPTRIIEAIVHSSNSIKALTKQIKT